MYIFDWSECWDGTEFLWTEPTRLILTFDNKYIFRKFRFKREDIVTITDCRKGPLWSAIGPISEIDTTVASQYIVTRRSLPVVVVFKMCVASWSGWFGTALFSALRRPLIFCYERFRYTTGFVTDCWQWTYHTFKCHFFQQNSYFLSRSSQQRLSFASSYVSGFPCSYNNKKENRGEKVKINQNLSAADDRRLAADKAW